MSMLSPQGGYVFKGEPCLIIVDGESKMDKKSLFGVIICAVVLFVLGSFSNVVGYQSVKSTVNDSPLFQIRIQKATNHQWNSITSQYIGMSRGDPLHFPIRDNTTEQMKKAIDIISKMDDKTFEKFTELCIQRIRQNGTFKDMNPNEIVQMLRKIRMQPELISTMVISRCNEKLDPTNFNCYTILFGAPRCYIFLAIIVILVTIIYTPILIVLRLLTMANCPTEVVSECPTQFYTFCGTCKEAIR